MALLNLGRMWYQSNFVRKNFKILKSDRGQLVDHVDHGYEFRPVLTGLDQEFKAIYLFILYYLNPFLFSATKIDAILYF